MSLVEPSQENDQKAPEICLQEDNEINEFVPESQKYKKKICQRDKRALSPLSFFKEDLTQFKEGVLKVFKDKDTKTELEDCSLSQVEKLASSTLGLLKEDLNQLKEDVTSAFSIRSSKDQVWKHEDCPANQEENNCANSTLGLQKENYSQLKEDVPSVLRISSFKHKEMTSAEKPINRLSLLKEDLSNFKDDLSNVFRIGLLKEKDTAKEDASNNFEIKTERTQPCKSLFRRDQKTSHKLENSQEVKKTSLEMSEEQMDDGFRGNLSTGFNAEKIINKQTNELEGNDQDFAVCVEKTETSLSETQQSEDRIPSLQANGQRRESEEWSDDTFAVSAVDKRINEKEEKEEKPSETLPLESLSSGIRLFNPIDPNKEDTRDQPGDELWSVKNFACYLTFDPNTAHSELHLTESNRKATRLWLDRHSSDHPDQFKCCPQILCREGFLDSVYWEVVWSGGADIGVTYNSISRDGDMASCLLGHNKQSWSLECSEGSYIPCHNNKRFRSSSPRPFTHRVGVYLDWSTGSLSFYCVSQDTMVHLHTFTSIFNEALYPAFWVWAYDGSVSLCQVELDWERLLQ